MRRISIRAWALAAASGVLQTLIFPQPSLTFLSWVALAPLLVALVPEGALGAGQQANTRAPTPLQGFLLGYGSGVVWYAGTCYWVFHVMNHYGGLSAPVAAGLLVLFCLYLALYHGVFAALFVLLARAPKLGGARALALMPVLWVAVELARARITGGPWNLLGTAQVDNLPLARLATVTGVYGVSFAIALVNAAFAVAYLLPRARRRVMLVAAVGAALALQAGMLAKPEPAAATHSAVLMQQNLPLEDSVEWTTEKFSATLNDFSAASQMESERATMRNAPRLIVWPESPAPFFNVDPNFRRPVSALAAQTESWMVAGNLGVRRGEGPSREAVVLNSASLVSPRGEWTGQYDKVHLVPFGEYVPVRRLLGFAQPLTHEVGNFVRGSARSVFTLDGRKVAVFICYESIFPDEVRQ
ncbi:MAG: apolipoprotein N-acyltransferase, partial [Terriglobales bacterium]